MTASLSRKPPPKPRVMMWFSVGSDDAAAPATGSRRCESTAPRTAESIFGDFGSDSLCAGAGGSAGSLCGVKVERRVCDKLSLAQATAAVVCCLLAAGERARRRVLQRKEQGLYTTAMRVCGERLKSH